MLACGHRRRVSSSPATVYLTATLADDGVLSLNFGADPEAVASRSSGQRWRHRYRLILYPGDTPRRGSGQIRDLVLGLDQRNVVVIVPSGAGARYWEAYAALVLDKHNLSEGVERLVKIRPLG